MKIKNENLEKIYDSTENDNLILSNNNEAIKNQILIQWIPSYNGGSPILYFNVYISEGQGFSLLTPNTGFGDVTSYAITK